MMILYRRDNPDGTLDGVHMNGGDFDAECEFSKELVESADPIFLVRQDDKLILTADEGVATYQIMSERMNGFEPCYTTRLIGVQRPVGA